MPWFEPVLGALAEFVVYAVSWRPWGGAWQRRVMAGAEAQRAGELERADAEFSAALGLARRFGRRNSRVAASLSYMASLRVEQQRYEDAEALLEMALFEVEKLVGRTNPAFATQLIQLVEVYRAQRRYDDAEPLIAHALGVIENALGPKHPEVARCLEAYAKLERERGRTEAADAMAARAAVIRRAWPGPKGPGGDD